jgi:hypothetical protein
MRLQFNGAVRRYKGITAEGQISNDSKKVASQIFASWNQPDRCLRWTNFGPPRPDLMVTGVSARVRVFFLWITLASGR